MTVSTSSLKWTALMVGSLALLVGCARNGESSPTVSSATNVPIQMTSPEFTNEPESNGSDQAALNAGLEMAAKMREERIRGVPPPPSQFPFPNYDAGPLRPYPIRVNFYDMDDRFPTYLLCQYDIDVKNYNQSDEPKWFEASLEQIRKLGPEKFPPIKWIAVIIVNRSGWTGASTFEQAHKVGAIFKASDVFDSSKDLSQMIAAAAMDRHPFKYDTSQPTPGEQQRWVIVERHAATNNPTAAPK